MTVPDANPTTDVIPVLEEIYARIKHVHREIRPSDRIIADLEVDSMAVLEILLELEERFGVSLVEEPRIIKIQTIGELVELLDELRAGTKA